MRIDLSYAQISYSDIIDKEFHLFVNFSYNGTDKKQKPIIKYENYIKNTFNSPYNWAIIKFIDARNCVFYSTNQNINYQYGVTATKPIDYPYAQYYNNPKNDYRKQFKYGNYRLDNDGRIIINLYSYKVHPKYKKRPKLEYSLDIYGQIIITKSNINISIDKYIYNSKTYTTNSLYSFTPEYTTTWNLCQNSKKILDPISLINDKCLLCAYKADVENMTLEQYRSSKFFDSIKCKEWLFLNYRIEYNSTKKQITIFDYLNFPIDQSFYLAYIYLTKNRNYKEYISLKRSSHKNKKFFCKISKVRKSFYICSN